MNNNAQLTVTIPSGDLIATIQAIRETHAALRLIAASNFAGFIDLSRAEQRHALRAALTLSNIATDLADSLTEAINPDQG